MSWLTLIWFVLFVEGAVHCSFFDWLGWSDPQVSVTVNGVPLMKVPFEELAPEEKFLVEASKITGLHLSQLDTCQHKLVMKLKSSCGSLSEEDLAKFSVNLLNCQSAVEGRQEFPCSENMSLKACTRDMDAETWNAYHVIGNRARAVCYATRQQQFRALSEMSVNKLMSTVHKQISALSSLQGQQEEMASLAITTMNELSRGTREVIKSHNMVRFSQTSITEGIGRNVKQLEEEHMLIENMHDQFTHLMADLQQKIDAASKQVDQQSFNREQDHKKMMDDFVTLSLYASDLKDKIDERAKTVEEQNRIAAEHFKDTLDHLREINLTITYLTDMINDVRGHFENKIRFISYAIGKNGENLESLITFIFHSATLFLFMLISSFLQLPRTSKWIFLVASFLNLYLATTQSFQMYSLELPMLYTCITSCIFVDVITRWAYKYFKNKRKQEFLNSVTKMEKLNCPDTDDDACSKVNDWLKGRVRKNGRDDPRMSRSNGLLVDRNFTRTPISTLREEDENSVATESSFTRSQQRPCYHLSSPARSLGGSSVSGGRVPCLAVCKTGQRCKRYSTKESAYCRIHSTGKY